MPGPLNGLKQAMMQRQEAQEAASGGLQGLGGAPMPPSAPQAPTPMAGLQAAGPGMETPRMQMSPADRQQFSQDTGIAANPGAQDIPLRPDMSELYRRADALINGYKQQ